jgi:hypothetical protein
MNTARLLKLADFLEKLPRKKFYYGLVVVGKDKPRKELDCGSTGCAMGWCPVVFPSLVKYGPLDNFNPDEPTRDVLMKGRNYGGYLSTAEELFGLTFSEAIGLFNPNDQGYINEPSLGHKATPKQVASMIRRFVKKRQAQ